MFKRDNSDCLRCEAPRRLKMTQDTKEDSSFSEWLSDSEELIGCQNLTPKHVARTYGDSDASTPDSPVVWNYKLPKVDQKVKDAAEKLDLGIREWRKKRRSLLNPSPTCGRFKKDFVSRLRLAAQYEKNATNSADHVSSKDDKHLEESLSSLEESYKKEPCTPEDTCLNQENLLNDEYDNLFLQVDFNE